MRELSWDRVSWKSVGHMAKMDSCTAMQMRAWPQWMTLTWTKERPCEPNGGDASKDAAAATSVLQNSFPSGALCCGPMGSAIRLSCVSSWDV